MKQLTWRVVVIVLVLLAGVVLIIPSVSTTLPSWWTKILPKERIHLGLDLQGGMHLMLEVQTDKAVENNLDRIMEEMKETMRTEKVLFRKVERQPGWTILVQLAKPDQVSEFRKLAEKSYGNLTWVGVETAGEEATVRLQMPEAEVRNIRQLAASQALETIRNRIDQFGVSEPDIRPQGEDRILCQLPGVKDPQRAVDIIGKTALLEFKLVAEGVSPADAKAGKLPAGDKVFPMRRFDPNSKRQTESEIVLIDRTLMTGEFIKDAQVRLDSQYHTPYVSLSFDPQGARAFERITGENVKKQLAIVLDGTVYSAPVIQERIGGGQASITGSFSMQEARDLAIVLRAGALPAPVTILEQRTVGPSLGADSISKGLLAGLVASLLIVLFMVVYYRMSGVIADFALAINILLIFSGLAVFQATLTLPGIAGIILTIGMAVDANVLIFERIREELRVGKTVRAAIDAGFQRATVTIFDANLTTLIAAVVLFQFGTGPIRGFAVTLSIGLITNMFTAIFVTRVIFDYLLQERRMKTLSI